jgi:hypothetical protein
LADEPDFKLDPTVTERDLLHRIFRELVTIRKQNTELVGFYRSAETEVPESLRRFANYFHDLHDIKYMYEEHGVRPPQHVIDEIERLDDRYRQILKAHNTDGGAIEKVRREMANDKDNRYDHAKQLTFDRSDKQ